MCNECACSEGTIVAHGRDASMDDIPDEAGNWSDFWNYSKNFACGTVVHYAEWKGGSGGEEPKIKSWEGLCTRRKAEAKKEKQQGPLFTDDQHPAAPKASAGSTNSDNDSDTAKSNTPRGTCWICDKQTKNPEATQHKGCRKQRSKEKKELKKIKKQAAKKAAKKKRKKEEKVEGNWK